MELLILLFFSVIQHLIADKISFDGRSFLVNGNRKLFISGSVHYPRAPRSEWSKIIDEAKSNGLNMIQTYVFWDIHEPKNDEFYFPNDPSSSEDLVGFVKAVGDAGLYVHLRIAGYICAEWNYGGLPVWLRDLSCTFRTYDDIWMEQLSEFVEKTVAVIKQEKLLAVDNGPIIMLQIENEYGNMEKYYGLKGQKYVEWLSSYAESLNDVIGEIPWVMCQQGEGVGTAPAKEIVNACNGYYCDNWIAKHTSDFPNQPHMWTENWPGWFQLWGDPVPHRPSVDVAFSVARWFAKGGSYMNYYMFYGGSTFGRKVGGPLIVTSYDYDVQLNEYSYRAEPKFSLLQELHRIMQSSAEILLSHGVPSSVPLDGFPNCESHTYTLGNEAESFLIFLSNWDETVGCPFFVISSSEGTVHVPPWSVTILAGSNGNVTTAFNTKTFATSVTPNKLSAEDVNDFQLTNIEMSDEIVPSLLSMDSRKVVSSLWPMEQLSLTHDSTDYLWYSTTLPPSWLVTLADGSYSLTLTFSSGNAGGKLFYVFVNGIEVLSTTTSSSSSLNNGNLRSRRLDLIDFETYPMSLHILLPADRINNNKLLSLDILSVSMGLQNYGPYLEKVQVGIVSNITANGHLLTDFKHTIGLLGEQTAHKEQTTGTSCQKFCWYNAQFETPKSLMDSSSQSIALDLGSSMGKGYLSINGHILGRYWNITTAPSSYCEECDSQSYVGAYSDWKCRSGCGGASQRYYKVPIDWLVQPSADSYNKNTIRFFDELGGSPEKVKMVKMSMIDS